MTNKLITLFNQYFVTTRNQLPVESIDDKVKEATAVVMIEMARDCSEVDSSCQQVFANELADYFNLSQDAATMLEKHAELIDAEATFLYPFTHLLNQHFEYNQKLELIKMLWDAANQIDVIDLYEDIYIHKVAKLLHVTYGELMKQKPS